MKHMSIYEFIQMYCEASTFKHWDIVYFPEARLKININELIHDPYEVSWYFITRPSSVELFAPDGAGYGYVTYCILNYHESDETYMLEGDGFKAYFPKLWLESIVPYLYEMDLDNFDTEYTYDDVVALQRNAEREGVKCRVLDERPVVLIEMRGGVFQEYESTHQIKFHIYDHDEAEENPNSMPDYETYRKQIGIS